MACYVDEYDWAYALVGIYLLQRVRLSSTPFSHNIAKATNGMKFTLPSLLLFLSFNVWYPLLHLILDNATTSGGRYSRPMVADCVELSLI